MSLWKSKVVYGTLDLLVLKTLDVLGPSHGYTIGRRIHQVSRELLTLNQGTLYPALLRLEQRGLIRSRWGTTDNNRKARYYCLTKSGRKHLAQEVEQWEQIADTINRTLRNAF
jgi:transcriptional regulator